MKLRENSFHCAGAVGIWLIFVMLIRSLLLKRGKCLVLHSTNIKEVWRQTVNCPYENHFLLDVIGHSSFSIGMSRSVILETFPLVQ